MFSWDDVKTYAENLGHGLGDLIIGSARGSGGIAAGGAGALTWGLGQLIDPGIILTNRFAIGMVESINDELGFDAIPEGDLEMWTRFVDELDSNGGLLTVYGEDATNWGAAEVVQAFGNYQNAVDALYGTDPVDAGTDLIAEMREKKEDMSIGFNPIILASGFIPTPAKLLQILRIGSVVSSIGDIAQDTDFSLEPSFYKTEAEFDQAALDALRRKVQRERDINRRTREIAAEGTTNKTTADANKAVMEWTAATNAAVFEEGYDRQSYYADTMRLKELLNEMNTGFYPGSVSDELYSILDKTLDDYVVEASSSQDDSSTPDAPVPALAQSASDWMSAMMQIRSDETDIYDQASLGRDMARVQVLARQLWSEGALPMTLEAELSTLVMKTADNYQL